MILEQIKNRLIELGFTEEVNFSDPEAANLFLFSINQPNVKSVGRIDDKFVIEYE